MSNPYEKLLKGVKPKKLNNKPIEKPTEETKTEIPVPDKYGYLWVTMLIRYDLKGEATILKSFTKHKSGSEIKKLLKPKEPKDKISFKKGVNEEYLF